MNEIKGIRGSQGKWHEQNGKVIEVAVSYFTKIFSSSNPQNVECLLGKVDRTVTTKMNDMILQEFR